MLIGGGNDEATDQNGAAQVCVAALKSAARQCMTRTGSIMVFSKPPAASDGRPADDYLVGLASMRCQFLARMLICTAPKSPG